MKQRGFTLIELVITVTIMVILLALAAVNLSSTQASQRDAERATDVATISNNLETFYETGTNISTVLNRYPSTALLASGETSIRALLPDIDINSVIAPDATTAAISFIPATNAIETVAGVLPKPTQTQYVYQPIQTNGALCTSEVQECRRYAIFYRTEIDNTVKKVTSKHQ